MSFTHTRPVSHFHESSLFHDSRAQISIEMIIVMAALVAVVLLLVTQLQESGTKGVEKLSKKTDDIFKEIDQIK